MFRCAALEPKVEYVQLRLGLVPCLLDYSWLLAGSSPGPPQDRPSFEDVDARLYLLDLKHGFGSTAKMHSSVPLQPLPKPGKVDLV